jgi:hypothetical protein
MSRVQHGRFALRPIRVGGPAADRAAEFLLGRGNWSRATRTDRGWTPSHFVYNMGVCSAAVNCGRKPERLIREVPTARRKREVEHTESSVNCGDQAAQSRGIDSAEKASGTSVRRASLASTAPCVPLSIVYNLAGRKVVCARCPATAGALRSSCFRAVRPSDEVLSEVCGNPRSPARQYGIAGCRQRRRRCWRWAVVVSEGLDLF